jgi:hypothetical protein
MHLIFGVGDGSYAAQFAPADRAAFYLFNEPDIAGITGVRLSSPQHVAMAAHELYGDIPSSFNLLTSHIHAQHACGVSDADRCQIVAEFVGHATQMCRQWGNSTIDGLHGAWNLCKNVKRWSEAPSIRSVKPLSCPAISVGAGPSLDRSLDDLVRLRDSCLIVACDTVARKLQQAGCDPHVVTPLERLNSTAKKLAGYTGDAWCAGMPVIPKAAADVFKHHLCVSHDDALYEWSRLLHAEIYTGSTSGTMSLAVASRLTSGPVYLVGHDLLLDDGAYCDGDIASRAFTGDHEVDVMGNDGKVHGTKFEWSRAVSELAVMCRHRDVVNTSASYAMGVVIPCARVGSLPRPGEPMAFNPRGEAGAGYKYVRKAGMRIAQDFENLVDNARTVSSLDEMNIERNVNKRNSRLFAYILRPLYCQISAERRLGRSESDLVCIYRERVRNMGVELYNTFLQMQECF